MSDIHNTYCSIINNIHALAQRMQSPEQERAIKRRLDRIVSDFEQLGIKYLNPIGESYDETRLDCEASIASDNLSNLKIAEVVKPIIYADTGAGYSIIQRGVVIVK